MATYDNHLKLIGKRVVDFLLVLIELFARCYSCNDTRNIGSKLAISCQWVPDDPKFQAEGAAPTNNTSQETRLNDLSYSIKIRTDLSYVLSQYTRLTDRRTDRQLSHS